MRCKLLRQVFKHLFFLKQWQRSPSGFQNPALTSWDEECCWTCFEAHYNVSLCKAFALFSLLHYSPQPDSHALLSCSDSLQCLRVIRHDLYMKRLFFIHLWDSHWVSVAFCFSCCVFSNLLILRAQPCSLKPGNLWEPCGSESKPFSPYAVWVCVNIFVCRWSAGFWHGCRIRFLYIYLQLH